MNIKTDFKVKKLVCQYKTFLIMFEKCAECVSFRADKGIV